MGGYSAPPKSQTFFLFPADIIDQQQLTNPNALGALDSQIGFLAYGLQVNNPTAQWWRVVNLDIFIPPYTTNIQLPILHGTQVAQIKPAAPGGVDQYHSLDEQQATFTYVETSINAPFSGVQSRVQPNEYVATLTSCPD